MNLFKQQTTCLPLIVSMMAEYLSEEERRSTLNTVSLGTLHDKYLTLVKLGLTNSVNATEVKNTIQEKETLNSNIEKAKGLIRYVKEFNEILGKDSYLISEEQFKKVCSKYNLVYRPLSFYTGVIPEENIVQLDNVLSKIDRVPGINTDIHYVTEVKTPGGYKELKCAEWIKQNRVLYLPNTHLRWNECLWAKDIIKHYPECPEPQWPALTEIFTIKMDSHQFFVAAPESHFKDDFKITIKSKDPIVFQFCPYGVLIHSVWGEEADDKTLAKYKELFKNI